MAAARNDWDPGAYDRFRGLRLRPALDLLAQIGAVPEGDVVDLGCGNGAVAEALRARFGGRLIGVDQSAAMLDQAAGYDALVPADIAEWVPERPPAVIFSNAALHWLGDHAGLMPRLARMLMPGGVLAVQMPGQFDAPSHRCLREVAARLFPDRFDLAAEAPVMPAVAYWRMLAGLGRIEAWETEYVQRLEPAVGHPVRHFTESTAMRPVLARLTAAEAEVLVQAYEAELALAYPPLPDGAVLFPFRRVFFVLEVA